MSATKEPRRPDGSTFHMLAVPDDARVNGYIPPGVIEQLTALQAEYARIQQDWPPGLREGITAQIQAGASAFSRLYAILQDAASGQNSDSLQRAHDSRVLIRRWQPLYEQTQGLLVEIEDQRNSLIRELATELSTSKDYGTHNAGADLRLWLSTVS